MGNNSSSNSNSLDAPKRAFDYATHSSKIKKTKPKQTYTKVNQKDTEEIDDDEKESFLEKSNDENFCDNMIVPLRNHNTRRTFARRLTPPAHPVTSKLAKARMARNTNGARKQAHSMFVVTSSRANVDHTSIEDDILAQAWNTMSDEYNDNDNYNDRGDNHNNNQESQSTDPDNEFLNICEPKQKSQSENAAFYLGNLGISNSQERKRSVSFNKNVVVLRR